MFAKKDPEYGHVLLDDVFWTSYMGAKFQAFRNRPGHFNDEEWDLFFVEMSESGIQRVKEWLIEHTGAPYNYYDAIMSGFTRRHLTNHQKLPTQENTLFCSEVGLRLLEVAGVVNLDEIDISADRCSPERLYKLLRQYKHPPVAMSSCRVLLGFP